MIGRQTINEDTSAFAPALSAIGISKKNISGIRKGEFGEPLFSLLGARQICSLDASSYEQATYICDLNEPCPAHLLQKFSLVFDGGALEHVFNLPQAFKNCMEMVRVGGHFVQVTMANNYMGHGFWQLSPEAVYRVFSPKNGFSIKVVFLHEVVTDGGWYQVTDPAICGGRVELANYRPTYICTIAQRLADEKVFAVWPQQSDYVEVWKRPRAQQNGWPELVYDSIRQMVPRPIRKMVRAGVKGAQMLAVTGRRSPPFYRPYYRYISAHDVVRGQFDKT
jgi:hypothetical protein